MTAAEQDIADRLVQREGAKASAKGRAAFLVHKLVQTGMAEIEAKKNVAARRKEKRETEDEAMKRLGNATNRVSVPAGGGLRFVSFAVFFFLFSLLYFFHPFFLVFCLKEQAEAEAEEQEKEEDEVTNKTSKRRRARVKKEKKKNEKFSHFGFFRKKNLVLAETLAGAAGPPTAIEAASAAMRSETPVKMPRRIVKETGFTFSKGDELKLTTVGEGRNERAVFRVQSTYRIGTFPPACLQFFCELVKQRQLLWQFFGKLAVEFIKIGLPICRGVVFAAVVDSLKNDAQALSANCFHETKIVAGTRIVSNNKVVRWFDVGLFVCCFFFFLSCSYWDQCGRREACVKLNSRSKEQERPILLNFAVLPLIFSTNRCQFSATSFRPRSFNAGFDRS